MLRFHVFTDIIFFFESTLMDTMCSMDVFTSRVSGSHTYHMPPDRLLVCSLSVSRVSLLVLIWIVDSSMLTFLSYAYSF